MTDTRVRNIRHGANISGGRLFAISATQSKRLGKTTVLQWLVSQVGYDADECLIFPFHRDRQGYGRVGVANEVMFAHRVMCALRNGDPPSPKHDAGHLCNQGFKGCVNPKHLAWQTKQENHDQKRREGRSISGHNHYLSKLSEEAVRDIRTAELQWGSIRRLAKKYGVAHGVIINVRNRESYV